MHLNEGGEDGDDEPRGHNFELVSEIGEVLEENLNDSVLVLQVGVVIKREQTQAGEFQLVN